MDCLLRVEMDMGMWSGKDEMREDLVYFIQYNAQTVP